MADRSAARRWARAFIDLAAEIGEVDRLGQDLATAQALMQAAESLPFRVLCNPVFSVEERQAVLSELLGLVDVHPMTNNLLALLVERGRFALLPHVVDLYAAAADERAGRVRVEVRTAEALSDDLHDAIREALSKSTGREVLLDTRVDPSLLGGLTARVEGKLYDASLRTRLETIKRRLVSAPAAQA